MLADIIIFLGVIFCIGLVIYAMGAEQRKLRKRIVGLQKRGTARLESVSDVSLKRKTQENVGLFSGVAKMLPSFTSLGNRLVRAGIDMTPQQYALRRIFWVAGFTIFITLITQKSILLGLFIGIILGIWVPLKWMQFGIERRKKAFLRLFPDAIDLIVRGLRSGLPVSESIVLVSTEVPEPVGTAFTTISQTMKLGVPMEKALQEMAVKLDLTEFNFFCTSIVLQRETGGNLSEILNNLSEVLRGRYIMGMKIKAMSSEARASSIIIGALPFVVIMAVAVTSPTYMLPLIEDPRGNVAAAIAIGMLVTGMWVMNRMTKFEI